MAEGFLTSAQMFDSIIVTLNSIPVTGVENCIKIVECIQKLGVLKKSMEEMEAAKNDSHNDG